MVIFVSHFRLFPVLDRNLDKEVAYVATIAAGVGIWVAGEVAGRQVRRLLADVPRRCCSWRRQPRLGRSSVDGSWKRGRVVDRTSATPTLAPRPTC